MLTANQSAEAMRCVQIGHRTRQSSLLPLTICLGLYPATHSHTHRWPICRFSATGVCLHECVTVVQDGTDDGGISGV